MLKKIVAGIIIWFVQSIDVDIEKEGDVITINVDFYGKQVLSKNIPITSVQYWGTRGKNS